MGRGNDSAWQSCESEVAYLIVMFPVSKGNRRLPAASVQAKFRPTQASPLRVAVAT